MSKSHPIRPSSSTKTAQMDPTASFENEILSINPEHDLVFNKQNERRLNLSPQPIEAGFARRKCSPRRMKIISKMNEVIGIKPVGQLPTSEDWEDSEQIEKETIAMMRRMGLEPSIDRPPDENRTIATVPINDDVILMRNGHKKMSIFMGNTYFELKPRSEPSFGVEEEETSAETTNSTDFSDDVHIYEPIPLNSTNVTQVTKISEEDSDDKKWVPPTYGHFDSEVSSDSFKLQSDNEFPELSWRRRSTVREVSKSERKTHKKRSNRSESGSSSSNWWRSNDSSIEARDENNWRINKQPAEVITEKEKEIVMEPTPEAEPETKPMSNFGSPLFKPKELFMKKKAKMIQQVLSANQLP